MERTAPTTMARERTFTDGARRGPARPDRSIRTPDRGLASARGLAVGIVLGAIGWLAAGAVVYLVSS